MHPSIVLNVLERACPFSVTSTWCARHLVQDDHSATKQGGGTDFSMPIEGTLCEAAVCICASISRLNLMSVGLFRPLLSRTSRILLASVSNQFDPYLHAKIELCQSEILYRQIPSRKRPANLACCVVCGSDHRKSVQSVL